MKGFFPGLIACLIAGFGVAADISTSTTVANSPLAGSFQIRNIKFGDLLRPENANGAVGTPIVLYSAQPWKCMTWKVHSMGESVYQLQNHFTSKTFAPTATEGKSEQRVTQVFFSKQANENPGWQFTKLADGAYRITDAKSGKALTAIQDERESGVKIVVRAWQGKDEQKWQLTQIDPNQLTM